MQLIYANADDKEIGCISSLSSNFNEYISFICLNIENIKNKNLYQNINLKNCPNIGENYNYEELNKFVEFILDKEFTYFPLLQFKTLIKKLDSNDYEKLIQLQSIFINYEENQKVEEIIEQLDISIHFTGKKFIEENKLDNLQIINFIKNDGLIFNNEYKEDENFARLIGHINLDKIDNQFIIEFIGRPYYDYKYIMDKNYKVFINSIIRNVKSFQHLKILYRIFNLDEKKDKEIIIQIINFLNLKVLDKNISKKELFNILGALFVCVQLIDKKNENLNNLIKGIKFNFRNDEINEIFVNILNKNELKLNKNVIDILINTIIDSSDNLTNKEIIDILKSFSNKYIQINFLQKQKKSIITEIELYQIKMSDNLKYVFDLIKNGFFLEKYQNIPYIRETRDFMQIQIKNLEEFNFSIELLKVLEKLDKEKEENNLFNRLYIISLGNNTIRKDLYNSLIDTIDSCFEILDQIKEIIKIFSIYYPREEEYIII